MKEQWRTITLKLLAVATTAVVLGIVLFFLFLFSLMLPPYLQYGLWVLLPCCYIAAVALIFIPKGWRKRLGLGLLAVLLGCGSYWAYGFWRNSIPTIDDRSMMLWEYEPFTEGTRAAYLNEPSSFTFEEGRQLRLDGATALYPVYSAFVQATYPEEEYPLYDHDGPGLVACEGTNEAYERLNRGEVDIIFAAEPSQDQRDRAEQAGLTLHMTPIGREAFVFFVNSKNPVDGLTVEQIQGIYTGEIKNWQDVGGKRQSIRPFQREENSGSQSALLRLMEGLPLMEPPTEDRVGGMGGIIRQVADYRNFDNAIGFSFRFYASEMDANGQIKLLALDGVPATKETIRDGSYPISSSFYAITASPIGQPDPREGDETLDRFLDWTVSEQGQRLVEESGYVSIGP